MDDFNFTFKGNFSAENPEDAENKLIEMLNRLRKDPVIAEDGEVEEWGVEIAE